MARTKDCMMCASNEICDSEMFKRCEERKDQSKKEKYVRQIMGMLSQTYRPESKVYQNVEKGLRKLSVHQLDNLSVMMMDMAGTIQRKTIEQQ